MRIGVFAQPQYIGSPFPSTEHPGTDATKRACAAIAISQTTTIPADVKHRNLPVARVAADIS